MSDEADIEAINDIESGNTEKIRSGRDLINMVKRELDESIANAECKLALINLRAKYDKALALINKLTDIQNGDYTLFQLVVEAVELLKELEGVKG